MAGKTPNRLAATADSANAHAPFTLQHLAKMACIEVELPPLLPYTLSRLGLVWEGRGVLKSSGGVMLVQDTAFSYQEALYLAASDGLEDLVLFLKSLIERRGRSCSEALILAADAGDLEAVKLCWKLGIRTEVFKAMIMASYRRNGDVVDFFLQEEKENGTYERRITVFENFDCRKCSWMETADIAADLARCRTHEEEWPKQRTEIKRFTQRPGQFANSNAKWRNSHIFFVIERTHNCNL